MQRPTKDIVAEYEKDTNDKAEQFERDKEQSLFNKEQVKNRRMRFNAEIQDVRVEIKDKFPDGKVTEQNLINSGITTIYPLLCVKCDTFKIFPYQFLTKQGFDNGKNTCCLCMSMNSSVVQKYTKPKLFKCECGLSFVVKDSDAYYKHLADKTHQNHIDKMLHGVKYSQKELRHLCSLNKITYYKNMSIPVMVQTLTLLGDKLKLN